MYNSCFKNKLNTLPVENSIGRQKSIYVIVLITVLFLGLNPR